jgi:hypothetical protein
VLIPVITAAETDHQSAALDNEQGDSVEPGMFQQQGFKSQNAPAKLVANEVVTTLADAVVQLSQARAHPRR